MGLINFDAQQFLATLAALATALFLGTIIGAERQYRQRLAGLRTNALVSLGACAFVDLGMRLNGALGAVQVLAYIASGVGFLGAGVIIKEGMNIRGLNTAATIWCSAVTGAFAGAARPAEAALLALFVIGGNTLLRPLVTLIERAPIDERASEATFEVRVTASENRREALRELVTQTLEESTYPLREIEEIDRDDEVEFVLTLARTSADPAELDAVISKLKKTQGVLHASWATLAGD